MFSLDLIIDLRAAFDLTDMREERGGRRAETENR